MTLRPLLRWKSVPSVCPDQTFEIQLDDSCQTGNIANCAMDSPEVWVAVPASRTEFRPEANLPVRTNPPAGARYAWRVRACAGASHCGAWSDIRYLHVGRVEGDVNGDGYGDILAESSNSLSKSSRTEIYFGGPSLSGVPSSHAGGLDATVSCPRPTFLGDVDGDGFGDFGCLGIESPTLYQYFIVFHGGSWTQSAWPATRTAGPYGSSTPFSAAGAGDLDGDGAADLAVETSGIIRASMTLQIIMLGTGVTIAGPPAAGSYPLALSFDQSAAAGDLDGDGFTDLVRWHQDVINGTGLIQIFRGGPSLVSQVAPAASFPLVGSPAPRPLGDINNDGFDDLSVPGGIVHGSATLTNDPVPSGGTSAPPGNYPDYNGDGLPDRVMGTDVYLSDGTSMPANFVTLQSAPPPSQPQSFSLTGYVAP